MIGRNISHKMKITKEKKNKKKIQKKIDIQNSQVEKNLIKKSRQYVYIGSNHKTENFLIKLANLETVIGHLAMRIIIGIFCESILKKYEDLDEVSKYEKITEAINTFSKRNFSILASSKMVKIFKTINQFLGFRLENKILRSEEHDKRLFQQTTKQIQQRNSKI